MIVKRFLGRHAPFAFSARIAGTRSSRGMATDSKNDTEINTDVGADSGMSATDQMLQQQSEADLLNAAFEVTSGPGATPKVVSPLASPKGHKTKPVDISRLSGVVGEYLEAQRIRKDIFAYGARSRDYDPDELFRNPLPVDQISLETLMENQTHLGHSVTRWNPANAGYIFGVRENTHIISLDVTSTHLRRAAKVVELVSLNAGLILFIGTRSGHERSVVPAARMANGCYLSRKYVPGTLTNRFEINPHCPLKVVDFRDEEVPELSAQLETHPPVLPDLIVCLNPVDNYTALHEAAQLNIPTIGIVDTNCDPSWVTYQIPANDDSPRSVQLITGALARAAEKGRLDRISGSIAPRIDRPFLNVTEAKAAPSYHPSQHSKKVVSKKQSIRNRSSRSVVLDILAKHEAKKAAAAHGSA